jgi:MSHA biogenesis protein MshQ
VPSPSGEALVSFVSGRLLVNNTYGSPNGYSPVKVNAQFWTGGSFANNPAYVSAASTSLASTGANANVGFSNCQLKAGGSCSAPALQAGAVLNFSGGAASFNLAPLSAPGAVDVTLVWPDPAAVPGVLLPNLVYLPSTTGRATFGVYRAGPVVYLREVF